MIACSSRLAKMYYKAFGLPVVSLLSLVSASTIAKRQNESSLAHTTSGLVQGHLAAWPANSSVLEFLGIPFAKPPVGQLRFAPPEAYTSNSSAVFVADEYVCPTSRLLI